MGVMAGAGMAACLDEPSGLEESSSSSDDSWRETSLPGPETSLGWVVEVVAEEEAEGEEEEAGGGLLLLLLLWG